MWLVSSNAGLFAAERHGRAFVSLFLQNGRKRFSRRSKGRLAQTEFTYILAVTKVVGSRTPWESSLVFSQALNRNPIRIIDLRDTLKVIGPGLGTTLAGTEVGRMLQSYVRASSRNWS